MLNRFIPLLACLLLSATALRAVDVTDIIVAKGQAFVQKSAGAPVPDTFPYEGTVKVDLSALGSVSSVTLHIPGHTPDVLLEDQMDNFFLSESFSSKAALDAAAPPGAYLFHLQGVHDGLMNPQISLGADAYPATPQIANWAALQAIDSQNDLSVNWLPFAGGTAQDFIQVRIQDYSDSGFEFFRSPDYGEPGSLNGTSSSVTVPAGTLYPGGFFEVEILFVKVVTLNTAVYPGAKAIAGYYKTTRSILQTVNPAGIFNFHSPTFTVYEHEGFATITVDRAGGSLGDTSVGYSTSDGTAHGSPTHDPAFDYLSTFGSLNFGNGETSKTFQIEIFDDNIGELTKTIQLQIYDPSGAATLGLTDQAVLSILDNEAPTAPNAASYLVGKGQQFVQPNPGAPMLATDVPPFRFAAALEATFSNSISGVKLTLPNNLIKDFVPSPDGLMFDYDFSFSNKTSLDAAYANGNYRFIINTLNQNLKSPTLTLTGDIYPPAPHLANWLEAQEIEPGAEFTFQWDSMGGNSGDIINLAISDNTGDIIASPWLLEPGALNGLATSWTIPANILTAGKSYKARILFAKRSALNTLAYPGVPGLSAYFKQTTAPIAAAVVPPAQGRLSFSARNFTVVENAGQATISVSRSGGSSGQVTVDYSTANGSAIAPADYAPVSGTLLFEDGETTKTFTIDINDDFVVDGNKSVNLTLSNPGGGAIIPNYPVTTLTILDNEVSAAGILQFSVTNMTVAESAGKASIIITRTGGAAGLVSVDLLVSDGTAQAGLDYAIAPVTTVFFNTNETTKTVFLPVFNDSLDETNETVRLALGNPTGGVSLGVNRRAILTITDDDVGGTIQFTLPTLSVNETSPVVNLTITRAGGSASAVTVDYATFDGTATGAIDYSAAAGTLTFGSNQMSRIISVPILNDLLPEGNETFFVRLSNPTGGAKLGGVTNTTVTIVDDESTIQFTQSSYTNSEATTTFNIAVQRTGPNATPATVDYYTTFDSAGSLDFLGKSGRLTFTPGLISQNISLVISNDTIVEGRESFQVCLTNIAGALLGARTNATVYLIDNDLGGTIQFSVTNFAVAESAGKASITLSRAGGMASGVTVDLTVADGTATAGLDYVFAPVTTVTFNANETVKTVLIPILNDAIDEPNETILLSLSNATGGANLGPKTSAVLTVTDDDVAGSIQFSVRTLSVNETGSVANLTVNRSGGGAGGVAVQYAAVNGTAANGVHFNLDSGALLFGSNQMSKTISVPIIDNSEFGGNRTFTVALSSPSGGAVLGLNSNIVVTILDNEPGIQFSSPSYTNSEGVTTLNITVQRIGPTATSATVDYSTVDGTASILDYGPKSGRLTFNPGVVSQTISLAINNDTLAEGSEWFQVSLANASGALLGGNSNAVVWIVDNDVAGTVSFNASQYSVNESGTNVIVTITRTGGTASGVSIDFQTTGESASPGSDYTEVSTHIVFGAGETSRRVTIPILNDLLIEGDETVLLTLTNPGGGASLGAIRTARLSILDPATSASGPAFMTATVTNISGASFFTDFSAVTGRSAVYSSNTATITLVGQETISDPNPLIARELNEQLSFTAVSITGPGVYQIQSPAGITFDYFDQTTVLGQPPQINANNHYFSNDADTSLLGVDVVDLNARIVTGRFELTLTDLNNSANKIHVHGSFRIPLTLQ